MQYFLGLYIKNNVIKYSKIKKDGNLVSIILTGEKYYFHNVIDEINKIIYSTDCQNVPIYCNPLNMQFYYAYLPNLLNKKDMKNAIDLEFELFCSKNKLNSKNYSYKYFVSKNLENPYQNVINYIITNNDANNRIASNFHDFKFEFVYPTNQDLFDLIKNSNNEKLNNDVPTRIVLEGIASSTKKICVKDELRKRNSVKLNKIMVNISVALIINIIILNLLYFIINSRLNTKKEKLQNMIDEYSKKVVQIDEDINAISSSNDKYKELLEKGD